jgi:hypothetical protein
MFQIRRAQIEMPALIAVFGLKAGGGRFSEQRSMIVPPELEIAIDGRHGQHAGGRFDDFIVHAHSAIFENLDGAFRRNVTTFFIKGADFEGGNDFAVAFHFDD